MPSTGQRHLAPDLKGLAGTLGLDGRVAADKRWHNAPSATESRAANTASLNSSPVMIPALMLRNRAIMFLHSPLPLGHFEHCCAVGLQ
jgi:hypothetical protein